VSLGSFLPGRRDRSLVDVAAPGRECPPRKETAMIEREERDGVLTLRLAHKKASALDAELVDAVADAFEGAADAGAVVLTGTGSIFSAGVDLCRVLDGGAAYVERFLPGLERAIRALFAFPRPVVAAVNGHAIAGGCILAQACDYRLMARGGGRIGVPELLVGVPFPALALEVVRFAVSPARLQEIVYLGRTYAPDEALERGLVDELVEPDALAERAHETAVALAAIPSEAFTITKRAIRRPVLHRTALATESDRAALAAWSSPATHDHIRAYLDRTIGKRG
jgi:enoyl-CoA hydratase